MPEKRLSLEYVADAKGVSKAQREMEKANQSFAQKLKKTGDKMVKVGKGLTLGLTLPIIAFGKKAIDEFGEAEKVAGQTAAAIASTGGAANVTAKHVDRLAGRIGDLAVMDDELVAESANVLLTFTKIRNEVGKGNKIFDRATLAVADMSTRLGTDMSSAAIQVGKALNDPVKGVTALGRAGVQFTEQQREQIEAMVEAGDVAGAQKVILDELETQFAGSAKAAGDAATPTQRMSVAFGNLAEAAGKFLVPILSKLGGWLQGLARWFDNLGPAGQKTVVTMLAVAAAVGPLLIVMGKLLTLPASVAAAWGKMSAALAANPYMAAIIATVAVAALIIANWDKIKEFLAKVWNGIKRVAETVWGALKRAASAIWTGIRTVIVTPVKAIGSIIGTVLRTIKRVWKAVWNGIKRFVETIIGPIIRFLERLIDAIRTAIRWLKKLGRIGGTRVAKDPAVAAAIRQVQQVPNLQHGGITKGPAVIGEAGRELFGRTGAGNTVIPLESSRGRRILEDLLGGGGGGAPIRATFNITVPVHVAGSVTRSRDLAREIRDGLLEIKREVGDLGFG